jgi:hypothetical protein
MTGSVTFFSYTYRRTTEQLGVERLFEWFVALLFGCGLSSGGASGSW